jgi:hypothetical protein
VEPGGAARLERLCEKRRLHQRLAAGKRDPATGSIDEHAVLVDLGHHLGYGHVAPDDGARAGGAEIRAIATRGASFARGRVLAVHPGDGVVGTHRHARTTDDATIGFEEELGFDALAFRAVAPPAAQRTAFEEDGHANARAIVHGEPLDVEDGTGPQGHAMIQPPCLPAPWLLQVVIGAPSCRKSGGIRKRTQNRGGAA